MQADENSCYFARNIKCMRTCAGVASERGVKSIFATYTCVQFVLLDRINLSNRLIY